MRQQAEPLELGELAANRRSRHVQRDVLDQRARADRLPAGDVRLDDPAQEPPLSAGELGEVPGAVSLAAYRVVQEALTNAVKHAPGAPTEIRLAVAAGEVTLTADSRITRGSVTGTGLGLVSMRERAESLGGSCEAGPGGRGWLVRARLPFNAGAS